MKSLPALLLPLPAVLLGGCFSNIAWRGIDGKGPIEPPPVGVAVIAAGLDVVTAPVLVPGMVIGSLNQADRKKSDEKQAYLTRIRANPEVIFSEDLHRSQGLLARQAVGLALAEPQVPFTDAQLRRLYREMSEPKEEVLANPHCSPAFLQETLATLRSVRWTKDTARLAALVANPALPRDTLQTIAADPKRFGAYSEKAQRRLAASE